MAERGSAGGFRGAPIVRWLLAHRALVFVIALALALVAGHRTIRTYSALTSDLEELLPESAPSVLALGELRQRLPGIRHLGIVIDTGGRENVDQATRFADALAERIRAYPPELVRAVRTGTTVEREFLETYLFQLMDPADVRKLADAVEARRDWHVTRAVGAELLDDTEDPPPELPLAELREKYEARFGFGRARSGDRFVSADGRTVSLLVQTGSHRTDYESDRELVDRVRADVAALGFPDRLAPGMRLGFAGDVATRVEETEGLEADLTISALVVLLLNVTAVYAFYRSWWALPIVGLPLLAATLCSFAVVALPPLSIQSLNSNTAFLGSIVTGNGVNSGIILLARVQEEQRLGADVETSILTAVRKTWRTTLAAALGAGAAYASLIFTDFRGFNQFGWIGGLGLVICWLCAYLLVPPLVYELARRKGRRRLVLGDRSRLGTSRSTSSRIGSWIGVRARAVVALTVLASVVAALGLWLRRGDWIEYDLGELRRRDSWASGERYWGRRMDAAVGRYLTPAVAMTRSAEEARLVEERLLRLEEQGAAGGLIASVRSARTWLPETRAQALAEAERLRRALTPRLAAELSPRDRSLFERALSERSFRPLAAADIPETLLTGLREVNGRIDRNVLVFPKLGGAAWNVQKLSSFVTDVREAAQIDGKPRPVAGALLLSGDIARTMKADGPRAVVLSLAAVIAICAFAFRSRARPRPDEAIGAAGLSLAAVVSLLTGILAMLGCLAWSGEKFNFCNFVALPITFGVAADYSINMLRRYQSEDRLGFGQALSNTSGAVALCSATTIIGFGSLLMAQNRALFSFGLAAIVGELTCLVTAIVALPAALALLSRRAVRHETPLPRERSAGA